MVKKDKKFDETLNQKVDVAPEKLKMRKLVDHWSFGVFLIFSLLKFLQLWKKFGVKIEENGWRIISGAYLRSEHSKFMLASFRLNYHGGEKVSENGEKAKELLINRLAVFLQRNPSSHWAIEWGRLRDKRKKVFFTDIIEGKFDQNGVLLELIPHLDKTRETFALLEDNVVQKILNKIVKYYNINEKKRVRDHKRARIIYKKLRHWVYRAKWLSFSGKHELYHLIGRILNATFMQFEVLDNNSEQFLRHRFATPRMKRRRHPGFGLLNILCRFTADYSESDLWFQYHHVLVDGQPMLEMLSRLKEEWGEVGPVQYPALTSDAAKLEIVYFGNKYFRARIYVNFEKMIMLRAHLNGKYHEEMGGKASFAAMIVWGLAQQKYFRDRKFIIPIDAEFLRDRNVSFIIIRPTIFFNKHNPLEGFLKYQRACNERILLTKQGKSESYHLFELYAAIYPLLSRGRYLTSKATDEFLGTEGLSILKDAEMFISALPEVRFKGFAGLGNLKMPTEDGKMAGAVTVWSTKEGVREYIRAFYALADNYHDFLGISNP